MTYILIFAGLFLIFILGVYFQGSNKSHKVRQADLKDIGIISHYKGKPFTGTTEEKNGDKTEYLNGLKHGLEIAFRNGSIYYKINYVNDHAKGSAEFFGINGNLIAQGEFDKKTIGTWTYYHNGKIFKIKENPQLRVKDLFNKRFNPIDIREENFQYLFSAKGNHKIEISNSDIIQSKTSNKFYLLNAHEAGVFDFILGIEYVYQETLQMDLKSLL